jgi:BirA family biotin operon repressor/biotin-[acetyl-CoA-carboxylase] ligase
MERFNVLSFEEIDSTNRYALDNLYLLPDRQIILAKRQTGGYGRYGRRWFSQNPGNIYMSLVLKPVETGITPSNLNGLSLYMSVVLCELLGEYGVDASIKWPNDVLVNGAKIAGLLGEAVFQGERLKGYVLGCGVNLNMRAEDLEAIDQSATSLNLHTGKRVARCAFLDRLIQRFFSRYDAFLERGFPLIRRAYEGRCAFLGKEVRVKAMNSQYRGIAKAFTTGGELILETGEEEEQILRSGDVRTVRLSEAKRT